MRRSKRWQAVTIVERIERKAEFDRGTGYRGVREVKKLITILLLTTSVGASAADLPQWEVNGFPATTLQLSVLQPKNVQESIPPPASPRYGAIIIIQGNGRVHTVKFDLASPGEQEALALALEQDPVLAARVRSSKNILFVDSYEPLNVDLK